MQQLHIVLYKTYKHNPRSAYLIIREANRLLRDIPGIVSFFAGETVNLGRGVGDGQFDVVLSIVFASGDAYRRYMSHSKHMEFVKFILHGYMIEGSTASDPEAEFIASILRGRTRLSNVVNPKVPPEEIVWGGELVVDAVEAS